MINKSFEHLELIPILVELESYCRSKTAKLLVKEFNYSKDYDEVSKLLEYTENMVEIYRKYQIGFYDDFDATSVLDSLKIEQPLTLLDIIQLKEFLLLEKHFVNELVKNKEIIKMRISELFSLIVSHNSILVKLEGILDNKNEIRDQASKELYALRQKRHTLDKQVSESWKKILDAHKDIIIDGIITSKNGREVVLIDASEMGKIKGTIVAYSSTKKNVYVEPKNITLLVNQINDIIDDEKEEIYRILRELSSHIYPYYNTLETNMKTFINLDFILAKASYSIKIDGITPTLNKDGDIKLYNVKNPLIDINKVVPIDILFDKSKTLFFITGSNTGGKTAALKSLGLMVLLNQFGVLIPVSKNSTIPLFNNIYADIGDTQSIVINLSTFSGHISQIAFFLKRIKSNDLLLLDEICSGTDPVEGSALALGICNYLLKKNIKTMLTTHYASLKDFGLANAKVVIGGVDFDIETLSPLYKVTYNSYASSNAILISQKYGLKQEIIEDSTLIKDRSKSAVEKVNEENIKVINSLSIQLDNTKNKLNETESLLNETLTKNNKLEDSFKIQLNKLKKEYADNLTFLKKQVEEANFDQKILKSEIENQKKDISTKSTNLFKVGDYVQVIGTQMFGYIEKVTNDGTADYVVSLPSMSLRLKEYELTLAVKPIQLEPIKSDTFISKVPNDFNVHLDLRGTRVADVVEMIGDQISETLYYKFPYFFIIHGFGTGAIKTEVHKALKNNDYILKYEINPNNGGETIAWLK